jgi:hypothetical protein
MWGMAKPDSDYDLFVVYLQSYEDYMRKGGFVDTFPHKQWMEGDKEMDAQYMELGHLVQLLKKGNVNMIWGVCSPIVHDEQLGILGKLREIVLSNLSKETYASVNGMAHSQMNDTKKRATVRDPAKNRATAARTLKFGVNLLKYGKVTFDPVFEATPADIGVLFRELDEAKESSILPDYPDPKPFEDFMLRVRLEEIERTRNEFVNSME